jgi:hypothetical protein
MGTQVLLLEDDRQRLSAASASGQTETQNLLARGESERRKNLSVQQRRQVNPFFRLLHKFLRLLVISANGWIVRKALRVEAFLMLRSEWQKLGFVLKHSVLRRMI